LLGLACIFTLFITFLLLGKFSRLLPSDRGRAFASQGDVSIGKPTGSGLYFITAYLLSTAIFLPLKIDYLLFYVIVEITMLLGFLDDRAKNPWHEYFKGALDLLVSFVAAMVFALTIGSDIVLPLLGRTLSLPFWLFVVLGTLLVWASINVTNCTDGVDGLSSSLTIISLISFISLSIILGTMGGWFGSVIVLLFALLAYLWFNTSPSKLLMGDAGSRALGIVLALSALFTKNPLSYLAICLIFILDGGAGLAKISLKRFLHIKILKNTTTPIHDHFRERSIHIESKKYNWKNQTLTARFSLANIFICSLYLFLVYIIKC
jgi:phospho-N-acetylmuramoyl-pentapeptide-transferase